MIREGSDLPSLGDLSAPALGRVITRKLATPSRDRKMVIPRATPVSMVMVVGGFPDAPTLLAGGDIAKFKPPAGTLAV